MFFGRHLVTPPLCFMMPALENTAQGAPPSGQNVSTLTTYIRCPFYYLCPCLPIILYLPVSLIYCFPVNLWIILTIETSEHNLYKTRAAVLWFTGSNVLYNLEG